MRTRRGSTAGVIGAIAVALVLSLAGGAATAKKNKVIKLVADLSAANEVPPNPSGSGTANVKLKKKQKKVCFNITFQGIEDPNAGHIHQGATGVDGPIVVPLFGGAVGSPSPIKGCVDSTKKLIKQIAKNPNGFYVNLHTPTLPDGAIRGQLHKQGGSSGNGGNNGGGGGYTY